MSNLTEFDTYRNYLTCNSKEQLYTLAKLYQCIKFIIKQTNRPKSYANQIAGSRNGLNCIDVMTVLIDIMNDNEITISLSKEKENIYKNLLVILKLIIENLDKIIMEHCETIDYDEDDTSLNPLVKQNMIKECWYLIESLISD